MRILIVQTAFIGDSVLTTPLVRAIRKLFPAPDNAIEILVSPLGKGMFDNNPNLDEIIVYDKRGREKGIISLFELIKKIRQKEFDLAILPHRSYRSGLICKLAGIPRRIGFQDSPGAAFYTDTVERPEDVHEAERMLFLTGPLCGVVEPIPTELFPDDSDYEIAEDFLSRNNLEPSRTIVIAPGSVWGTKRYPANRFAEVIDRLIESDYFDSAVIIGSEDDREIGDEIIAKADSKAVLAIGLGDIMVSTALIDRCGILIGNDSAPVHIAAAMRTAVVAIFGPTVTDFGFTPYFEISKTIETDEDLECRPCSGHGKRSCSRHDCMKTIPPGKIVEAAIKLICK